MGGRELLFCRLSETGQGLGGLRGGAPPEHTSLLGLRTVTDDSFGTVVSGRPCCSFKLFSGERVRLNIVHSSSETDNAAIKPLGTRRLASVHNTPTSHTRAQRGKNSYIHPQNEQLQWADTVLRHTA